MTISSPEPSVKFTGPTTTVELSFKVVATVNRGDWHLAFGVDLDDDPNDLREYVTEMARGIKHDGVFGNGEVENQFTVTQL